ncbi:MAG: 16S rRNA (uracil(1498)-N(3))-methyltransferase [Deltaproteobacteria bacterium]|nr:16S rRNA (uracil(1498)-N(3))-methyltransferase [Deltaproteobacteria bacterium]
MVRLFVPPEQLQGERATLDAAAHRHLVKVLRLGPGAALQVFDGKGTEIEARIAAVGKASLEVTLGDRRRIAPPPCAITLLVSPPRGERMDLLVQKTTELGVARIVPVRSERGMVKSGAHQRRRWQKIAEEAARQSGRADVPLVSECLGLATAVTQAATIPGERFLLWEDESERALPAALAAGPRAVVLLVGPEGGLCPDEVARAQGCGFRAVGLGPRILRSETAAVVAVALAQAAAGGLG